MVLTLMATVRGSYINGQYSVTLDKRTRGLLYSCLHMFCNDLANLRSPAILCSTEQKGPWISHGKRMVVILSPEV